MARRPTSVLIAMRKDEVARLRSAVAHALHDDLLALSDHDAAELRRLIRRISKAAENAFHITYHERF